ncbi:hypothetical protein [Paenibacillus sp. Y412MC10]|uniref:hypothetical protein n=1 Tax=Geobacillus sp. (strain Y412MC10) TaxID=481743 RepID=UPI0011AB8BCE|nr:hypothetical protein [Paenibacillus sp. Y412MC10]
MITILLTVAAACVFLFAFTTIGLKIISRKIENSRQIQEDNYYRDLISPKKANKKRNLTKFYLASYSKTHRLPLIRNYIRRVRRRISSIHAYDELTLRKMTMRIVFTTLSIVTVTVVFLIFVNRDLLTTFLVLLAALVIHGTIMDSFINKVEDRLMKQLADMMSDVRYHYHQHGLVDEAISEASEVKEYEASLHAKKVYSILRDNEPEKALEEYYEVAPNRFLKVFAGIAYLVKEFGDKTLRDGSSMFLSALDRLKKEINLEVLRRARLNYYLRGLTVIAITPILFTKAIENWARSNFPAMTDFYISKLGLITKLVVFAVIVISYILLRKIQESSEGGRYVAKTKKFKWEKRIYEIKPITFIVDRMIPSRRERTRLLVLLKESNSPLPIEWFFIRRLVLSTLIFTLLLSTFIYMHSLAVHNVLYAPTKSESMFGELSADEKLKANQTTEFDRNIMNQLKGVKQNLRDRVALAVKKEIPDADDRLIASTSNRIITKTLALSNEYLKWWEVLLAVGFGWMGYQAPVWILMIQKRIRAMDMQNEVEQLHSIIAMLSEIERVSVETILEWMERFSTIFKEPLQKCLLNYNAGPEEALEQLKEDAPFLSFVRTVERLQVAVSKISVKEAFDDLETDRAFNFEQRKQDYEKIIETKKNWGQMLGFAPMYALVFLYLVIPLIYMSLVQMNTYYDQIHKISNM